MDRDYKYKELELSQLRSFCRVASAGNFTSAARGLGRSTSAIWQQVRALERAFGERLFHRRGRAVELTPEGRLLLELVQPHVGGLDSLARLFQKRKEELPGQLTVAATPFFLSYDLAECIRGFTRARPSVQLAFKAGRWHEVLGWVERGEADLGIAPRDREEPRRDSLEYELLFSKPLMVVTPRGHPLARKKRIAPGDLVQYPIIVEPKETCDYRALMRLLHRHNIGSRRLRVALVSHTMEMTFKYVSLGIGIAVSHVSPRAVGATPRLSFRALAPRREVLPVEMVTRKGSHPSEAAAEFRRRVSRFFSRAAP
jgi:DNA-binding transcriptional LysR family regulator